MGRGVSEDDAVRQARIEFGGIEQAREKCREVRKHNVVESILQNLRFGFRMLRKSPGFATPLSLLWPWVLVQTPPSSASSTQF
jgi:hypothetical protein